MPTTYAHYRFGAECISVMPEQLQKIVNEHRALFDIGVHGPDIFFYDLIRAPYMIMRAAGKGGSFGKDDIYAGTQQGSPERAVFSRL